MKRLRLAIVALFMLITAGKVWADGPGDCLNIPTDKGRISGSLSSKAPVCVYKGIPFATPPVGALRFTAPREPAPWPQTFVANKFGNECTQYPLGMFVTEKPTGAEDCLYLNVWQPVSAAKQLKPVMVFIHGGGFVMGSGSQDWYESSSLASQGDVVVVTINYRLGPFGFMVHPALKDTQGHEGNYGFLDQVLALRWVNKNIRNFGGDPKNITIFGESAGGMSVGLHLISPLSKGLFQKAIIESGPAVVMRNTLKDTEATGMEQAAALGCGDAAKAADCLRALDPAFIMSTLKPVMSILVDSESGGMLFSPSIDGYSVPDSPLRMIERGDYDKNVKVILGSNENEAALFTMKKTITSQEDLQENLKKDAGMLKRFFGIDAFPDKLVALYPLNAFPDPKKCYNAMVTDVSFTCPTKTLAQALAANGTDTYQYLFTKPLFDKGMMSGMGAFHGAELFFVFNVFNYMGISAASPENSMISKSVIQLWTSFAHNGIPKAAGVPTWPRFDMKSASYLRIGSKMIIDKDIYKTRCDFIKQMIIDTH